jgi:hypothetical protein
MNTKRFHVDSHQREAGSKGHGNFNYLLELPKVKGMNIAVLEASVPKSFYLVRSPINVFTLTEGAQSVSITVTPGNYNAINFASNIKALLEAASPNARIYTITFDSMTAKYAVSCSGAASLTFPAAPGGGIHEQFGCSASTTYVTPFTAPNCVNFQLHSSVHLRSNLCNSGDSKTSDVLQVVSASGPAFSSLTYQCAELRQWAKPLTNIGSSIYNFYVSDPDGNELDLNGHHVTFTILVYSPLDDLVRDYIAWKVEREMPKDS